MVSLLHSPALITSAAGFLLWGAASAATLSVQLETDTIEVDQTIRAVVNVVGYDQTVAPSEMDPVEGVAVRFAGASSGLDMSGRTVTRTATLVFEITGTREGVYPIGPFDVYVDGVAQTTDSLNLAVTPPTDKSGQPVISVFAAFPSKTAWEGQVVIYHYGYQARVGVAQDRWVLPPFDRLQPPRDGLPITREFTVQDPSGPITRKENWHPLLATAPGELGLVPASAILRIQDGSRRDRFGFMRTRDLSVLTEPAPLTVMALPPAPDGFAGLVGDFEFTGSVDNSRVRVGESATWTVSVIGDGSLEGFSLPDPPETDALRFYDNTVGADARVWQGGYRAEGRWQRVIVPTVGGQVPVPEMQVVSFSPTLGEYVTHRIEAPTLDVRGGEGPADVESFAPDGQPLPAEAPVDDDIREIRPSGPLHTPFLGGLLPLLFALAGGPGAVLLAMEVVAALKRRRKPVEVVRDPLDDVHAQQLGSSERLAALDAAVRHALTERTGSGGRAGLGQLSGTLAQETAAVMEALGRARFADGAAPQDLDQRAIALVLSLREAA